MKKVEIERQAIASAIAKAPNITVAAKDLGASRRTLQNRMRDYGMPAGESGRPRHLLPKSAASKIPVVGILTVVGVLIGGALGLGIYLARRKGSTAVAGGGLIGLDLLGATK